MSRFYPGVVAAKPGTPSPPTLAALTLSASTIAENSAAGAVVGAIQNKTAGSTLSLTDTAGSRFAISGTNLVTGSVSTDYETATSHSITIRETLVSATNSPRDTVLSVTVTNVAEGTTVDPAIFGMPTAANTGVRSGVTLTPYTGPSTITTPGTVIQGKEFTEVVTVRASNVTFRDCLWSSYWIFAIDADSAPVTGMVVEHCTFIGGTVATNCAILGTGTFRYNDISNSENGIVVTEGSALIHDNYIHALANTSGSAHIDGISVQGGQNGVLILHNTIQSWDTSCVFIKNDGAPINDITVRDNLLINDVARGQTAVPVYVEGASVTNILVENNYVNRGAFGYYSVVTATPTIRNNTEWQTGVDPIPYPTTSIWKRPITRVGLNLIDGADYPHVNYGYPSAALLNWVASTGVNHVRLSFRIEALEPTIGATLDSTQISALMTSLDAAQKAGLTCNLNAHNFGRNDNFTGERRYGIEGPGSALGVFWGKLATAVKDHPALMAYGLMNEPPWEVDSWKDICQDCINTIRAIDARTPIIAPIRGSVTWNIDEGHNDDMATLTGNYVAIEGHQYPDWDSAGTFTPHTPDEEYARPATYGTAVNDWMSGVTLHYRQWLASHSRVGYLGETGMPSLCWYYSGGWSEHWDARTSGGIAFWRDEHEVAIGVNGDANIPTVFWCSGDHAEANKLFVGSHVVPSGQTNLYVEMITRSLQGKLRIGGPG